MSSRTKPSTNGPNGRRARRADHELAQPGLDVLPDHPAGAVPAGRDQRGRVGVRPAAADRGQQRVRDAVQRHRQAEPEVVGVHLPPGLRRGVLDHADRGARLGGGQQRAEPPVGQPPHPAQPGGGRAAQPDVERLGRQRADAGAGHAEELPLERDRLRGEQQPQQGAATRRTRRRACRRARGNSARSAGWAGCSPNTGSTRPGASPASDASCLATSTGCRPGSTEIPLPAFSRRVRDSANAMPVNGSTSGEYTFSGSHSESTPACSSRSTASANASGVPAGPRDTPIRTFMPPSDHRRARLPTPDDSPTSTAESTWRRRPEGFPGVRTGRGARLWR